MAGWPGARKSIEIWASGRPQSATLVSTCVGVFHTGVVTQLATHWVKYRWEPWKKAMAMWPLAGSTASALAWAHWLFPGTGPGGPERNVTVGCWVSVSVPTVAVTVFVSAWPD